MPHLNNLTLEQLTQLTSDLREIEDAGRVLHAAGLDPVFDLTPGAQMRITTSARMPVANSAEFPVMVVPQQSLTRHEGEIDWGSIKRAFAEVESPDFADRIDRELAVHYGEADPGSIPSFLKHRSTEAAPTPVSAEPVDAPLALGEVAGGAPISAAPSRSDEDAGAPKVAAEAEAKAESGGGSHGSDPAPAALVPRSESAAASAPGQWAGAWSDEQDAQLIAAIATAQIAGTPKADVFRDVSIALGRSFKATEQRGYRLNGKVKAEIARRAMTQAQTETPEIPAAATTGPGQGDAAVGDDTPTAVQHVSAAALDQAFDRRIDAMPDLHGEDLRVWQWIAAHRAKWPHTAGTDLDLAVGLGRGEKIGMIAVDLGIDVKKLQERWDCLTRPIRNAQDKITIDGMPRLINVLRRIAKAPAAAA